MKERDNGEQKFGQFAGTYLYHGIVLMSVQVYACMQYSKFGSYCIHELLIIV